MKKVVVLLFCVLLTVMLVNCAGTSKPMAKMADVPEWYLNPPQTEDAIYQAGDALKMSMALAKDAADSRARDAIARTIEVKVTNMMKDFMQQSGMGQDAEAIEFTSSVSKQVSSSVLKGCKIVKRDMKVEGTSYHGFSLAEYSLNPLVQETLDVARKQKSLYNKQKPILALMIWKKKSRKWTHRNNVKFRACLSLASRLFLLYFNNRK